MALLHVYRPLIRPTLFAIILGGCATLPSIPELSHPESSGLALDLRLRAPIGPFSRTPDQIYFVKIDSDDTSGPRQIVPSNYSTGSRAYLLNARPGTYVAVAASLVQNQGMGGPSTRFTTYFSKELVEQTKVTLREHDFAFMGTYIVDNLVGFDGREGVDTDYTTVFVLAARGDVRYRGVLREGRKDEQARNDFFRKAKEDLAGSGWTARIK